MSGHNILLWLFSCIFCIICWFEKELKKRSKSDNGVDFKPLLSILALFSGLMLTCSQLNIDTFRKVLFDFLLPKKKIVGVRMSNKKAILCHIKELYLFEWSLSFSSNLHHLHSKAIQYSKEYPHFLSNPYKRKHFVPIFFFMKLSLQWKRLFAFFSNNHRSCLDKQQETVVVNEEKTKRNSYFQN